MTAPCCERARQPSRRWTRSAAWSSRRAIDCGYSKQGSIIVATSEPQRERLESYAGRSLIDADAAAEHINIPDVLAASYSPHGARVDPARLVRGLADTCEQLGVTVYEQSEVLEFGTGSVRCRQGTVRADVVLGATESYTTQLPGERMRYLPLYSLMIATEPLPDAVWAELGWRDGLLVGDMHHLFFYAQRTIDDRIAIGGRGAPYQLSQPIAEHNERSESVRARLVAALARHFPAAADAAITHHWGGPLAVPRDWSMSVGYNRERGYGRAGGILGSRRGGRKHRRSYARRPRARTRHRSGVTAVGRSPQPRGGSPSRCDTWHRGQSSACFTTPTCARMPPGAGLSGRGWSRRSCRQNRVSEPSGVLPAANRRDPPAGRCRRHSRIHARSQRACGRCTDRANSRADLIPPAAITRPSAKCTSTRFRLRMPPLLHFWRLNPHLTGEDFVRTWLLRGSRGSANTLRTIGSNTSTPERFVVRIEAILVV